MLILIAGISGNIGQHAATYGLSAGHSIRGLGRSPYKLPESILGRLESFIPTANFWDISALDAACAGVDAIICAYGGMPELHLDAQLLLLRAAERAGITRFLAASWNYDWRVLRYGIDEPVYDGAIAFARQAAITSSIKPLFILSGMLAEVFFGANGQDGFTPKDFGVWEAHAPAGKKSMDIWGTGEEPWNFTTEEDAGKWGIEAITAEEAEEGGFVAVCSFTMSLNAVKEVYERVRATEIATRKMGTVEELEALAVTNKNELGPGRFWEWHRYWFHYFCVKGTWNLQDLQNRRFERVAATTLEQFLIDHPEI